MVVRHSGMCAALVQQNRNKRGAATHKNHRCASRRCPRSDIVRDREIRNGTGCVIVARATTMRWRTHAALQREWHRTCSDGIGARVHLLSA
jgi:hypothetical protein